MKQHHLRSVVRIGSPLLAGIFAEYVMFVADSAMIGRLGTDYLAAVAVGGIIAEMLWAFTWTTMPGTQALSSRRFGIQAQESAEFTGEVIDNGILFGLFAGILAIGVSFLARDFLELLISSSRTIDLGMEYIVVIRWSMPIVAVFHAFYGFLAGINETRKLMYATVGINAFNIFLNYLFIYGKLGMPALGITGAALGTLLANAAGLTYMIILLKVSKKLRKYGLFKWHRLKKSVMMDIGKSWLPVTLQYLFNYGILLVYEGIISGFGTIYLAVFHIIFAVNWLGKSISGAFAEGGAILVGNALGRKEKKTAEAVIYACFALGLIVGFGVFVLATFVPGFLVRIFNSEPDALAVGSSALKFFAPFFFIASIGFTLEVIFTNNGWGRFVLIADVVTSLVFTIGFTLGVVNLFGGQIKSAWLGFGLYLIGYTIFLAVGFYSRRWAHLKIDSAVRDSKE